MGDARKRKTAPAAPELYPGHRAELKRQARRNARIAAASAKPLPGPLRDAFAHVPRTIGGLTVRPVVHYDFVILQQLDSPFLDHLRAQTKRRTQYTDQQGYEMVLQFTRPVKEVRDLVAQGVPRFRQLALEEIGDKLGPVEVALLVKQVELEFVRAFKTAVRFTAQTTEDGTVFTPPPAAPRTAPAGG